MMATLSLKKKDDREPGELCNEWLHSFPVFQSYCLFAIGVIHQLKPEYDSVEGVKFTFSCVRRQMRGRTGKLWYKELIWSGAMRYNLDGTEYGWQEALPGRPEKKDV